MSVWEAKRGFALSAQLVMFWLFWPRVKQISKTTITPLATLFVRVLPPNIQYYPIPQDDCVLQGEPTICSSDTGSSNGGLSPLLYSPGAESWGVLTGCSGPNASRAQPFIGQEKGKNEGKHMENEKEHEQDDEAERGGAFGPRFTGDTRLGAARAPGQISRSPRTREYLAGASRDQVRKRSTYKRRYWSVL